VVGVGETPDAEHSSYATVVFDGLAAELQSLGTQDGFWSNIPEHLFQPLVRVVAAEIAPTYGFAQLESRSQAMIHLMAQMRVDDREAVEPEPY
jgi:hypothetical protein